MKQDDIKYNASKQSAKHDNLHFLLVSLRESGSGWRSETNKFIKLTRLKERDLPSCTFERSQFTYMQFMNFFFSDCKLSRINFEVLRYLGRKTFLFVNVVYVQRRIFRTLVLRLVKGFPRRHTCQKYFGINSKQLHRRLK